VTKADQAGQHFGWNAGTGFKAGNLATKHRGLNQCPVELDLKAVGLVDGLVVGAGLRAAPAVDAEVLPRLGGVTPEVSAAA
jgi:hypothetical protein